MTTEVKVNMYDASTGATTSKTLENVTKEKMAKLETAMMHDVIIREFDKKQQIAWLWIIEEIEIIKP